MYCSMEFKRKIANNIFDIDSSTFHIDKFIPASFFYVM